MPSPLPPSIPDTQLGLSSAEVHLLRHHQALALAPSYASSTVSSAQRYGSASAGRGRGSVRSSATSSRAGSAGSAATPGPPGQGRLVLDAGSLSVLGAHFERVMARIQERVEFLSAQTTLSTTSQSRSAASTIAAADAEIARFKDILRQIDELETEFDKVRHIRDIVKSFRARVEGIGGRLGRR
ncbi:hypothetical protein MMC34_007119 [Xylographa carneopallida]|nr:hypothetical protein [Xylographa carneopallida]